MTSRLQLGRSFLCLTTLTAALIAIANRTAIAADDQAKSAAPSSADSDAADVVRILAAWEGLQSEISTCRIGYRSFHNSLDGKFSLDGVDAVLDSQTISSSPEGLRTLITTLNGGPFPVDPPWGEGHLVSQRGRVNSQLGSFQTYEDDEISLHHDAYNRQYTVSRGGTGVMRGDRLDSFRWLPQGPFAPAEWRVLDRAQGQLCLAQAFTGPGPAPTFDPRSIWVDAETGCVRKVIRRNGQGEVIASQRFLESAELPGGISMPRAIVEVMLKAGVAVTMHALVVDRLEVNIPLDDAEFRLPARKEDLIVDTRGSRKHVSTLKQDDPDLASYLKDYSPPAVAATHRRTPARSDQTRNWFLIGNGILLVGAGLMLWRRMQA